MLAGSSPFMPASVPQVWSLWTPATPAAFAAAAAFPRASRLPSLMVASNRAPTKRTTHDFFDVFAPWHVGTENELAHQMTTFRQLQLSE